MIFSRYQPMSVGANLTSGEVDVTHGDAKWLTPFAPYGSGKINGSHGSEAEPPKLPTSPPMAPLALAEARVSQVEAELRLVLVETQASCLEERLSRVEAELDGLLRG